MTFTSSMTHHGKGIVASRLEADLTRRRNIDVSVGITAGESATMTDLRKGVGRGGGRSGFLDAVGREIDVAVQCGHGEVAAVIPTGFNAAVTNLRKGAYRGSPLEGNVAGIGDHGYVSAESIMQGIPETKGRIDGVVIRPGDLSGSIEDILRAIVPERNPPIIRLGGVSRQGDVRTILPP